VAADDAPGGRPIVLIDACVLINLTASRHADAVLGRVPWSGAIVAAVQREVHLVRRGGVGDDADEREPLSLESLVRSGGLAILEPTDDELEAFVVLSQVLGDGEAMTIAVALARGYGVATDDRKARHLIGERVSLLSTLDLMRAWADAAQVPDEQMGQVLIDIGERGAYIPSRAHPLRGWWDRLVATEQRAEDR